MQSGALEHFLRLCVEFEARQHLLVPYAAAWIPVHDLHQLRDAMRAVADDMSGRAARCRHERAVDHQQAMIIALQEALDDHRPGVFASRRKALGDFGVGGESNRDAAPVVAVVRLGHHRKTDALGRAYRLSLALHQFLPRHRQTQGGKYFVGFFLVASQLHRDVRRTAGDRRLDALLVLAVTQLNQGLIVEAQPGDAAVFGRPYQCGRTATPPLRVESLGGADVHCRRSGVTDYYAQNDTHALSLARRAVARLRPPALALPHTSSQEPDYDPAEIYGIIPPSSRKPYDVREIIARLVDRSWFDEFSLAQFLAQFLPQRP